LLRVGHDLDPEDGRLSLLIGVAFLRLGESGEAEAYFLNALRQLGPSAEVYRYLAEVCYAGGRLHEAQSFLEQAVELRPEDGNYRALLDKLQSELRIEEGMGNRHGGNFSISYVDGGERLGGETLEVLQEACARMGALFDVYPAQPVSVILYGARDFSEVTGAPDWAGGAYDGKIRVPVRGLGGMNDNLRRVLCHEYAHVLIHALTRGNLPRWLDEGLAQVTEGEGGAAHLALLERARGGVGTIPFSRLERSFQGLSAAEAAAAYLQSRDFVSFLLDRYGWPRMLDLLQALGRDDRAFAEAAGRLLLDPGEDFRAVQEEWLEKNGRGAA
jgi:tetratricopeptide (TPR) repeat protein